MGADRDAATVLLTHEDDGVALLVLKHPPVNALSRTVLADLGSRCVELERRPGLRAVVLAGDGPNFSAGADLKELSSLGPDDAPKVLSAGLEAFRRLAELPVPSIAAVHGLAVGGGLELALAADLRIADDSAKFGAPETAHGLAPAYGGTQRLPRLIGSAKAKELVFTGNLVPAAEALRIGLVNKVVGGGQELRAAKDLAHTIGQRAPRAVRAAKRAISGALDRPLNDGLALESKLFLEEIAPSQDLVEGLRAFAERRSPKFTGD